MPDPHAHRRFRLICACAVCLSIGAAANFAISAAIPRRPVTKPEETGVMISHRGASHVRWVSRSATFGREYVFLAAPRHRSELPASPEFAPITAPSWVLQSEREAPAEIVNVFATGAPMRSFFCWAAVLRSPVRSWSGVHPGYGPGNLGRFQIMYRPIWPGLIVNTLFYACLAAAPLPLFRRCRAHLRRRCNTCPHCAYDLRGITSPRCPECGATRAPQSLSPPRRGEGQ